MNIFEELSDDDYLFLESPDEGTFVEEDGMVICVLDAGEVDVPGDAEDVAPEN